MDGVRTSLDVRIPLSRPRTLANRLTAVVVQRTIVRKKTPGRFQ
jgi:hypothetical protein